MLEQYILWNDHIKTAESKLSKNIGLLSHASYFLHKHSPKTIIFPMLTDV